MVLLGHCWFTRVVWRDGGLPSFCARMSELPLSRLFPPTPQDLSSPSTKSQFKRAKAQYRNQSRKANSILMNQIDNPVRWVNMSKLSRVSLL